MLRLKQWLRLPVVILTIFVAFSALTETVWAKEKFAAVTVDARTGDILFDSKSNELRHPASLTKMMTLYLVFQDLKKGRIKLSTPLRVSARASRMAPSKLGLKAGSTITVELAIKALIVKSANDAATVISENLGGTESAFAARMTRTAHALGMKKTRFLNASGLPNPDQVTTARDMATLGLRLMRDYPQYYPYFRMTSFTYKGRVIRGHNRLVGRFPGTDGIKTGYVNASGFNLVTSTRRGDKRLVGVVLGGKSAGSRNAYMMLMLNKMFAKAKSGKTIAALAGSSVGVVDPIAKLKGKKSETEETLVQDQQGVIPESKDTAALAAVSEEAAELPAVSPIAEPTVIEAELDDKKKRKVEKLPFEVKPQEPADGLTVASLKDDYAVQIGKFKTQKSAEAVVTKIDAHDHAAKTLKVKKDGKIFYRLVVSGYDKKTAKASCAKVAKLGKDCTVLMTRG